MDVRQLTCIGCPLGCQVSVTLENGDITEITGFTCKRGEEYARKEVTDPTRIVTSTVMIEGGTETMLPVKTASDVPKGKIFDCVKTLKGLRVKAPVHTGDVVVKDAAGTGVDIVATKDILAG